jgi:hypothetical protein
MLRRKEKSFWHDGKMYVIEFVRGSEDGNLFRISSGGALVTSMFEPMTIDQAIFWYCHNSHLLWR